jgi:hypothetical protein
VTRLTTIQETGRLSGGARALQTVCCIVGPKIAGGGDRLLQLCGSLCVCGSLQVCVWALAGAFRSLQVYVGHCRCVCGSLAAIVCGSLAAVVWGPIAAVVCGLLAGRPSAGKERMNKRGNGTRVWNYETGCECAGECGSRILLCSACCSSTLTHTSTGSLLIISTDSNLNWRL